TSNSNEACLKMNNIKFCFKLDKWPTGEFNFTQRMLATSSLNTKLINNLEINCCLIRIDEENASVWQVDTSLAETSLFKSLSKYQMFKFYYFYVLINNLKQLLAASNHTCSQ